MGDMTKSELRDELRYEMRNRDDLDPGRLDRWVFQAYSHVSMPTVHKHRELELTKTWPLVLDDPIYDISTTALTDKLWTIYTVKHIEAASATDYDVTRRKLTPREQFKWDAQGHVPQGRPTAYSRWGEELFLNHRPSNAEVGQLIELRGRFTPGALTADGSVTLLHPIWDEVIVAGATWYGWRRLGRPDLAEPAKEDFARLVNEITETQRADGEDPGRGIDIDTTDVGASWQL